MSWRRDKTSGWAAFDPKKQQKKVTNHETHKDPFPLISNIRTRHHHQNPSRNADLTATGRSFSSVPTHSASLPDMMNSDDIHSPLNVANFQNVPNSVAFRGVPNLLHADYLTANSLDIASSLLREMASPGRLQEKKGAGFKDNISEVWVGSCVPDNMDLHVGKTTTFRKPVHVSQIRLAVPDNMDLHVGKTTTFRKPVHLSQIRLAVPDNMDLHVGKTTTFRKPVHLSQTRLAIKHEELFGDHAFSGKVLHDNNETLGLLMNSLSTIPVEPEWEDDDFYLMHRKEAIRATRLASRYSKAATEAYLRKDHAAAKEFSIKAREEWRTSEKLNAKAAKEILAIRNSENDEWKLDLHGLHAAEAVKVLQEHLLKIESQVSGSHSTKPDKTNLKVHSTHAASIESVSSVMEKLDRQQSSGPRLLEVITGKGSHSQGQAVLPVAIRSFLSEKRYNYHEARTGVITVLPKFRQLSTALLKT